MPSQPYHPEEFAVRDRLDPPPMHAGEPQRFSAPRLVSSAESRAYHQQRLTLAQQQQQELEKRIAHTQESQAQKSQLARASAYLLEVWHGELARWKAVEQAADRALRGIG